MLKGIVHIIPKRFRQRISSDLEYLKALKALSIIRLKGVAGNRAQIFSDIYSRKAWGDGSVDFFSGPGSTFKYTSKYEEFVCNFVKQHNIRSIIDIGCGDFQVGSRILEKLQNVTYNGVDIVNGLIERNKREYQNDRIKFFCIDAAHDDLPDSELALVREVIQHLSIKSIYGLLGNLGKYKYVLVTEHCYKEPRKANVDISDGEYARVDLRSGTYLDLPPFNLKCREVLVVDLDENTCIRTILITNLKETP